MADPNPAAVVKHLIELMGGHEKAFETFDAEYELITTRWNQDTGVVGRILRAHLFVEHFLGAYVQAINPKLGSLEDARLTFAQKVSLADGGTSTIAYLIPGIPRLNAIRNRLAHSLRAEVTTHDADAFLQIGLFR